MIRIGTFNVENLDGALVSRQLPGSFSHAEIHNEVLPDESGAFRTDVKFPGVRPCVGGGPIRLGQ
jgi:hypothetical protein